MAITFYNLLVGEIAWAFDVAETASPKPGNGALISILYRHNNCMQVTASDYLH